MLKVVLCIAAAWIFMVFLNDMVGIDYNNCSYDSDGVESCSYNYVNVILILTVLIGFPIFWFKKIWPFLKSKFNDKN